MKTRLRWFVLVMGLVITLEVSAQAPGNKPDVPVPDKKDEPSKPETKTTTPTPAKGSLEDYIAKVLANDPDIAFSEAKIRVAEARLQKARQAAVAKVTEVFFELETAKSQLLFYEKDLSLTEEAFKRGGSTTVDLAKAKAQVSIGKAVVMGKEAALQNLIKGVRPAVRAFWLDDKPNVEVEWNAALKDIKAFNFSPPIDLSVSKAPIPSVIHKIELSENQKQIANLVAKEIEIDETAVEPFLDEKKFTIRTLWKLIEKDFKTKGLSDVMKLRAPANALSQPIEPVFGKMHLGAVLEMIEDSLSDVENKHVFVIREYGLLLTDSPRDAVLAVKYWKAHQQP
jgi:hypothetical protein